MRGKVLFLMSHLGSGYSEFARFLIENPRIQGYDAHQFYTHPNDVFALKEQSHKNDTSAAIHMVNITRNQQIQCKSFFDFCHFIYLVREPHHSLSAIIREGYAEEFALRYYALRLQRLAQTAKLSPGAVFLTWDALIRAEGFSEIEDYLGLAQPLRNKSFESVETERLASLQAIDKGHQIYAKCISKISQMNHLKTFIGV